MGRTAEILRAPRRAVAAIPPATRAVAAACLLAHLMQRVVAAAPIRTVFLGAGGDDLLLVPDVLSFLFAISGGALSLGFLWTPVTYLFLHAGWSHLLLNGIGLLVFGSAVEREAGRGAFWTVWFGAGVAGGAGWALAAGLFVLNALELAFVVSSTAYLAHLIGIAAGAAIGLALRRREARHG